MTRKYDNIYFIGIGGIGMSAIARYYKFKGYSVSGYDRTPSPLTEALVSEGIPVHYTDDPAFLPEDTGRTLVVYTPAVPEDLKELRRAFEAGYKVLKRSRVLGEISEGQSCLAVSGTHGKTTTSTLLAHILRESGVDCSAFLGGISRNYGTNMLAGHDSVVVAEADEYDRSFLQLHPHIAVITSMDADHLDIYGDVEHVREAFRQFASQVDGEIILKYGLPVQEKDTPARIFTYHFDDVRADFHAENISTDATGHYTWDLCYPGGRIQCIRTGVPGWINVENGIAAAAVCLRFGVDGDRIRRAIASFRGVKRRLEEHVSSPSLTYLDDYAHHPAELSSAISSIRNMFPSRRITAVFQPHLYTRTRDFAPQFAEALSAVDKLILLDIYPARELPIEGVSSELIFNAVTLKDKVLLKKEELMDYLAGEDLDVLVTFGAGDIDRFTGPITEMLEKRI